MQTNSADAISPLTEPDFRTILATSAVGALTSLIITGCLIGVRNDFYFLPILGRLYDLPQFSHDTFVQSLRYYASGVWILLSGLANYVPVSALSLALGFFSRWLAFLGFGLCADLLGARTRKEQVLFAFFVCATSLLRGQSWAGDGGLFINYFSHSELANGLTLILLYTLIRQHLILSCVLGGIIFFDNAFIAVWDGIMAVAVVAILLADGRLRIETLIRRTTIGLILAILLAAPVLLNVLHNPDFGKPLTFDYVAYLEEFWPYHFIFRDIPSLDKAKLCLLVGLGFASFAVLGRSARPFAAAFVALLALYAIGIVLPDVTHSPTLLNLHLLRDSTILQLLATLAALTVAVKWWYSDEQVHSRTLGPLLAIALCIPMRPTTFQPIFHLTMACGLLLLSMRPALSASLSLTRAYDPKWPRLIAVSLIVIELGVVTARNWAANNQAENWIAEWSRAGHWAKQNTASHALFLLPTWYFRNAAEPTRPGTPQDDAILNSGIFRFAAERRIWIDFRDGAAVMWSPSYYKEWRAKVEAVNQLTDSRQQLNYARQNRIDYLVNLCGSQSYGSPVYSSGRLCISRIEPRRPPFPARDHAVPIDQASKQWAGPKARSSPQP